MAYDEELAERIRELFEPGSDLVEKKMFGGLSFMVDGNMAVAASGKGGLLVRVNPKDVDRLMERESVDTMVMGGREMIGWLYVAEKAVADDTVLAEWVARGVAYARSLPAKKRK